MHSSHAQIAVDISPRCGRMDLMCACCSVVEPCPGCMAAMRDERLTRAGKCGSRPRKRIFRRCTEHTRSRTEHSEPAGLVLCLQPITAADAAHTVHPRVHVTSSLFSTLSILNKTITTIFRCIHTYSCLLEVSFSPDLLVFLPDSYEILTARSDST